MKINLILLWILCTLISLALKAQNLIQNPGFEEHREQTCLGCNTNWGKYGGHVYNWDNRDWGCVLCDKKYKIKPYETEYYCPFDKMSPKEGNAMIQMRYAPECGGNIHEGADYLSGRTTQPMEVGKLYEVSFWVNIESKKRSDPNWAKHIGISLLPQNLKMHSLYQTYLIVPFLPIDTVIYDTWYQVKWRVRPLCTSKYLMIGVYETDEWHQNRSYVEVRYFVDNVSVTEIPSLSAAKDSSIYYCSKYDPKTLGVPPEMENQVLLFQNKAFDLTPEHQAALDSFSLYAQANPSLVFELSGHTDSIGSGNLELSRNRAQSVFDYLTTVKQLSADRFILFSKGSEEPLRPNHTEAGRIQNRRAEIRQSRLELPMIFYRNVLKAVEAQHYAAAFSNLNKWLISWKRGMKIFIYFDPRLEPLKKDPRWAGMDKKVREEYKKLKYPEYSFRLDSLRADELKASGDFPRMLSNLTGYHPEMDTNSLEIPGLSEALLTQKYAEHFAALQPILAKTGWPKKSEFGESASGAAFMMLLNSGNIVESLKWLPQLQKTCEEGEAPWIRYAMLYDRCNRALGKPQRYGTVAHSLEGGGLLVEPWEGTVDSINEYRAKIGLEGLSFKVVEAMESQD